LAGAIARPARRCRLDRAAPCSYKPGLPDASGEKGCRVASEPSRKEIEMPKMKTKSGAKKRFKVTATGRIVTAQAGKRHGMIKRSNKFIRNARGTMILSPQDEKIVKQFLPYA
jgi:large subunit ribosomal protein L35